VKKLPLVAAVAVGVVIVGGLASIVTQGFRELAEVKAEHRRFAEEKARLERRIGDLHGTLSALRADPAAVESLARIDLGWVRPGETVIVVATPTPAAMVRDLTQPEPTPILSLRD
jgi:cell division protein FtsB